MKNQLNVTVVDNGFVITETVFKPTQVELGTVNNQKELAELIKSKGYKMANLTKEAKELLSNQLAQEREDRKKASEIRKLLAKEKQLQRIAKMEAKLAEAKARLSV